MIEEDVPRMLIEVTIVVLKLFNPIIPFQHVQVLNRSFPAKYRFPNQAYDMLGSGFGHKYHCFLHKFSISENFCTSSKNHLDRRSPFHPCSNRFDSDLLSRHSLLHSLCVNLCVYEGTTL